MIVIPMIQLLILRVHTIPSFTNMKAAQRALLLSAGGRRALSTSRAALAAIPRQKAPAFQAQAVVGDAFEPVSLADYSGKWLVLFSYPLDFTFVCPSEVSSETA